jgi:cytochrome P450
MTTAHDAGKTHPAQAAKDLGARDHQSRPCAFDMFLDPATMADPYPLYERLLAEQPVQAEEGLPIIVTSYNDVGAALRNPLLSTDDRHDSMLAAMQSGLPAELLSMQDRRSFLHLDPPDHTRLRRLVGRVLNTRRFEAARCVARQAAADLIDAAAGRAELELVADFAYPLPLAVISSVLGLPLDGDSGLPWWRSQMCADFEAPAVVGGDCADFSCMAQAQMIDRFDELIASKRQAPGDDVATDLLRAQERSELTAAEVNDICRLITVAAHETTTSLIANGMLALLRNHAQLELLRARPLLTASAVDEVARYDPPIQFTRRIAAADTEVNGTAVHGGRMVLAWIAAANRDPDRFARPNEFLITRPPLAHLGFGAGIHSCLGSDLASATAEIALATLSNRLVGPELKADPPTYMPNAVHAIEALPVAFRDIRPTEETG